LCKSYIGSVPYLKNTKVSLYPAALFIADVDDDVIPNVAKLYMFYL